MNILYCDDDKIQLDSFIQQYAGQNDDHIEICLPEELMERLQDVNTPDILLMDLELNNEKTGLDHIKEIQQKLPNIVFIYVTAYSEKFVQDAFHCSTRAAGFLTKPMQKHYLQNALNKARAILSDTSRKINITPINGSLTTINEDEILYIESNAHKAVFHTENELYTVMSKLSDIAKGLSASFEFCHKSFIVNMKKVRCIEAKSISLINGNNIPLSYNRRDNFKIKYMEYIKAFNERR